MSLEVPRIPKMVAVSEARQAEEGGKPSASPIYRHPKAKDAFPPMATGEKTLYDLWHNSAKKHADNPCLGKRSGEGFEWMTYKQVDEATASIASGLKKMDVERTGRVGIFGQNSPEWMISMQACNRQAYYCVPLYDTLGEVRVRGVRYLSLLIVIFRIATVVVFFVSFILSCFGKWLLVLGLFILRSLAFF